MAISGQTFSQEVSPPVKFRVVFEVAEEGGYVVTCPALPGCISEGDSLEEAQANIQEAIVGYLESLRQHNEPIPVDLTPRHLRPPTGQGPGPLGLGV